VILRQIDIFVQPSVNEGISNTILEAMATALPVVAMDVGGNRELIVDGKTGRLCRPGDPSELSMILRQYVDDVRLRKAHGAEGRVRVVRHFTLDRMVAEYAGMYRDAVKRCRDVNVAKVAHRSPR